MNNKQMMDIVQLQIALDLNCSIEELNGEKDSIIYIVSKDNEGRRPFPRGKYHFQMLSMGKTIVVSASEEILEIVKTQLIDKGRDEAFSMPFIYGHSLYYLPDLEVANKLKSPKGFVFELIEQKDIATLYKHDGFKNALQYDNYHPRPDAIAVLARIDSNIVGIAGASADCNTMWQIGMDVLPNYRNHGIGSYLVQWLTSEILKKGIIPYYGTASSNIPSQRVAHRAGYYPAWMCAYKGIFEGFDILPTS